MQALVILTTLALVGTTFAQNGTFLEKLAVEGPNPTNVGFNLYVPATLVDNAPVFVAPHWCGGSGKDAYQYYGKLYGLHNYSDAYGFPIVYPDAPSDLFGMPSTTNMSMKCWDVWNNATLEHGAGGDSLGVISMVKQVLAKYNGDSSRVFVMGFSSGGMMTETLLGAYPDVFAAGAAFSGIPFGAWTHMGNHTGKEWAQFVLDAYPGYSGYRPKLQIYHGTADELLPYEANFFEAIKEWTNVFGIDEVPTRTEENTPLPGWTKTVYGTEGKLEGFLADNITHAMPIQVALVAKFFDLACPAGDPSCFHRPDVAAPTNATDQTTNAPPPTL